MLFEIVQVGDPVLRKVARKLQPEEILSSAIQELIGNMRETMRDRNGVGLAAPQIGQSIQVIMIEYSESHLNPLPLGYLPEQEREAFPFQVVINPRLSLHKAGHRIFFEACLSVPGMAAMVPRAYRVTVTGVNGRNEPVRIDARAWQARILQHEIDHLGGKLIVDRMLPRSLTTRENFSKYWKGKALEEVLGQE